MLFGFFIQMFILFMTPHIMWPIHGGNVSDHGLLFCSITESALLYPCILYSFASTFNLFSLCSILHILENVSTRYPESSMGLGTS